MDRSGLTALSWVACGMQRETFVVQLMPAGASAHNRKASKKFDHDGTLDLLIRHGANMEARDWAGWSTLMVATFYGQPTLVRALVEAGARIDHVDRNGKAALEMAASIDSLAHRQIARTLKRAGKTRAAVELSTRRWHELRWSSLGAFAALLAVCAIAFVRADNSLARALSSGGSRLQHDMRTNHTHGGGRRHTAGGSRAPRAQGRRVRGPAQSLPRADAALPVRAAQPVAASGGAIGPRGPPQQPRARHPEPLQPRHAVQRPRAPDATQPSVAATKPTSLPTLPSRAVPIAVADTRVVAAAVAADECGLDPKLKRRAEVAAQPEAAAPAQAPPARSGAFPVASATPTQAAAEAATNATVAMAASQPCRSNRASNRPPDALCAAEERALPEVEAPPSPSPLAVAKSSEEDADADSPTRGGTVTLVAPMPKIGLPLPPTTSCRSSMGSKRRLPVFADLDLSSVGASSGGGGVSSPLSALM